MIGQATAWIMGMMQTHGPLTVFLGVIVESIIVPIPSPLIIMGAGAILIEPGLHFTDAFFPILWRIVLPGALASTIGAYFTFFITYWGGKRSIDRFGRFLGFSWDDIVKMEKHLIRRVGLMIFLLRALPVVPLSLISAAAGVLRLPLGQFTFWTLAGSVPRCLILGYLGYLTRESYEGLAGRLNSFESLISAGIVLVAFILIIWLRIRMKKQDANLLKIFLITLLVSGGAGAGPTDVRNESSLTFQRKATAFICSGLASQEEGLARIELSKAELKKGTACAPGDFDGNGYLDFALFNVPKAKNQGIVFFYEKEKIMNTTDIFIGGTEIGSSFDEKAAKTDRIQADQYLEYSYDAESNSWFEEILSFDNMGKGEK